MTVSIHDKTIEVEEGLHGQPDLVLTADAQTWLKFLAREQNIVLALVAGRIKFKGPKSLVDAFARCFPL